MIVRRCAQDFDVVIHKNTKPGMVKTIAMADGTKKSLTYPSAAKDYFLLVDGEITQRSDSFATIETAYVKACKDKGCDSHGRIDIIKHKIINNKVVDR
jgi:hypothetical protein|tara:strand:+ start:275 stop:568 length:294 start_codon:yes stop_codon:yes gene_type:complete